LTYERRKALNEKMHRITHKWGKYIALQYTCMTFLTTMTNILQWLDKLHKTNRRRGIKRNTHKLSVQQNR